MSDDKLSQEEMREDIRNLLSWGHAHDYDDIIQEARADAWDEGYSDAKLNALMWGHTDNWECDDTNPYRKQEEA